MHDERADLEEVIRALEQAGRMIDAGVAHYRLGRLHALADEWLGAFEHFNAAANQFASAGRGDFRALALKGVAVAEARTFFGDPLPELTNAEGSREPTTSAAEDH